MSSKQSTKVSKTKPVYIVSSLYWSHKTAQKVKAAAKKSGVSVSAWMMDAAISKLG